MNHVSTHLVPDSAMHSPAKQGLKWALLSTLASAALIQGAKYARLPYFTGHPNAVLWGSLGIGSIGYLLGADLARAQNRTDNLASTYQRLDANHLLIPEALPSANGRQRRHQSPWGEALKSAAIQSAGSAALAIGVEAALTPAARAIRFSAIEWGPVGAIQGAISGALQARAHNKRADIINAYEAKAAQNAGFAAAEDTRQEQRLSQPQRA